MKRAFKFDENKRDVLPDGLTNGVRAEQAECGVLAASEARGEGGQELCEDAIRDLLADLGQGFRELGYISLPEILEAGAELDFHFTPVTVGEILKGG